MTQRKEPEKVIKGSTWITPENTLAWPRLHRTQTIKKNLDEHLVMQNMMPTTDKTELKKYEKKK